MAKSSSRSKKVAAKKTAPAKKGMKKAQKSASTRGTKKKVPPFPDDDFELKKVQASKRAARRAKRVPQVPPFPDDDHEL